MAGDTENPRVWFNADVYVGSVGSTAPTDLTTALDAAFEPLGLLSEDGLTETRADTSDDKYAWGGILVRTTRSKHKRTFKVAALENNPTVFALVNPGSTEATVSTVVTRTVKVPVADPRAFVIEMTDPAGVGATMRRVVPRGEVTEVGDTVFSDSEMVAYELTITVYPDSAGVLYKDITDDPAALEA